MSTIYYSLTTSKFSNKAHRVENHHLIVVLYQLDVSGFEKGTLLHNQKILDYSSKCKRRLLFLKINFFNRFEAQSSFKPSFLSSIFRFMPQPFVMW